MSWECRLQRQQDPSFFTLWAWTNYLCVQKFSLYLCKKKDTAIYHLNKIKLKISQSQITCLLMKEGFFKKSYSQKKIVKIFLANHLLVRNYQIIPRKEAGEHLERITDMLFLKKKKIRALQMYRFSLKRWGINHAKYLTTREQD